MPEILGLFDAVSVDAHLRGGHCEDCAVDNAGDK